jgi:hypothetical protein
VDDVSGISSCFSHFFTTFAVQHQDSRYRFGVDIYASVVSSYITLTMSQEDVKTDVSRSSNEKAHPENLENPSLDIHGLPPDPDAHMSAEERAAIVIPPFLHLNRSNNYV